MKSLIAFLFIIKIISSLKYHLIDRENFFYIKCVLYIILSSIHSTIGNIPIPFGALLMLCIALIDQKNVKIKLKMIGAGLFIILLSLLNFYNLTYPIKKAYLYATTAQVNQINLYSFKNGHQQFLISITDPASVRDWTERLNISTPYTYWSNKVQSTDLGYMIELEKNESTHTFYLNPYLDSGPNLFLGDKKVSYTHASLTDFFHHTYSNTPSSLTINTSKHAVVNLYHTTLLNTLWQNILWNEPIVSDKLTDELFSVPAYLFFDQYLGCRIQFTTHFDYASIDSKKIIKLPDTLSETLKNQYILSQTDYVNQLSTFKPAYFSNPKSSHDKYSIRMDEHELYFALYHNDYRTNDATLLHTVHSSQAQYFILNHPYILLLDEKNPKEFYLMLVNQNIPEKHRYIAKNEEIIPHSISLCPQNTKFTYIVNQGDTSTLYFVSNYYRSPQSIATGQILDSLFLSDFYIAFTQIIDDDYYLCIYSINRKQVIKHIAVPGKIIFTESKDHQITFAVQVIEGLNLREGVFSMDSKFNIYKQIPQDD